LRSSPSAPLYFVLLHLILFLRVLLLLLSRRKGLESRGWVELKEASDSTVPSGRRSLNSRFALGRCPLRGLFLVFSYIIADVSEKLLSTFSG
jgi:hypothetical protein